MGKPYSISITNGEGTSPVLNGNYSVTSSTPGYDDSKLIPQTVDITSEVTEYSFEIEATGTLTLHVSEDGQSTGTAVVGAKFIRCDEQGNEYGSEITSDSSGNAVFNNVPFASSDAPIVYYKQKSSDGEHDFSIELRNSTLTTDTLTVEILNTPAASKTFKLTDKNYSGLKVNTSTITLS